MEIIAQCPSCKMTWLLNEINQDRRVTCKKCRTIFRIPKLDELPKAKEIIKQAKSEIYVDEKGRIFG